MAYVVRPLRPFQWVEAARARHAVPSAPEPVDQQEITTLCGEYVVIVHSSPRLSWPECPECDRIWRDIENIPRPAAAP